jgi:HYR domain
MKQLFLAVLLFAVFSAQSQITFWQEAFGTGCNQGQLATNFVGIQGSWTEQSLGFNASSASQWMVSATENGNDLGTCGSGCGADQTLHISAPDLGSGADLGATYFEGIQSLCNFFPCGATNKRIESPVISCEGYDVITLGFSYIEGGNDLDNATLWYFDGNAWEMIADMPKTFSDVCSPQGVWTFFAIELPASAYNNPNVQIGFQWTNNDDGVATDPSFAVDDIFMMSNVIGADTQAPILDCPNSVTVFADATCSYILPDLSTMVQATDNLDVQPFFSQSPPPGIETSNYTVIGFTASDDSGNVSACLVGLIHVDALAPSISCPSSVVLQAPANVTSLFVDVPLPVVYENCSIYNLWNSYTASQSAAALYPLGNTMVTYYAEDASGNLSQCSTQVSILGAQDCCLGDFDCNGIVNVGDLSFLITSFGCVNSCLADLDNDGLVGVMDQSVFMSLYGMTCP